MKKNAVSTLSQLWLRYVTFVMILTIFKRGLSSTGAIHHNFPVFPKFSILPFCNLWKVRFLLKTRCEICLQYSDTYCPYILMWAGIALINPTNFLLDATLTPQCQLFCHPGGLKALKIKKINFGEKVLMKNYDIYKSRIC